MEKKDKYEIIEEALCNVRDELRDNIVDLINSGCSNDNLEDAMFKIKKMRVINLFVCNLDYDIVDNLTKDADLDYLF